MGEQQTEFATSPGCMGEQQTEFATSPGCMGEQQTKFATSHFNEAGIHLSLVIVVSPLKRKYGNSPALTNYSISQQSCKESLAALPTLILKTKESFKMSIILKYLYILCIYITKRR